MQKKQLLLQNCFSHVRSQSVFLILFLFFAIMFAYVHYVVDKKSAKVPVGYIKKFDFLKYDPTKPAVYRVFWNPYIHSIQNEKDEKSMSALRALKEPPAKDLRKVEQGDAFYNAYVLRVEDSLDLLIESINKKRITVPTIDVIMDEFSSTNEDEAALQSQKADKKKEEAGMKKQELKAKKLRAENILKEAKKTRKGFKKIRLTDIDTDCYDSEVDPEVIPSAKYTQLQVAYNYMEKEKEKIERELSALKVKYFELEKSYKEKELEANEVAELRQLNRQLQEKFLNMTGKQCECLDPESKKDEENTDSETMEVPLGAGISINRTIYNDIFSEDHVRKFTKSLAVAIWGTPILAERSVKGLPCRNRNGPRKVASAEGQTTAEPLPSKPPLTPEKLLVVSAQMRQYLIKRGSSIVQIEKELKNRNRYISDKIQDIRYNARRMNAHRIE